MALNPVVGGSVEFSFTDNPDWRSKVTSIIGKIPDDFYSFYANSSAINRTPGSLTIESSILSYLTGVYTITISATGYQDKVLTVTVQ